MKDHKSNFLNHPTTRLINPAKNEIGRINKQILDQTNFELCKILKDFFPSIKEGLLIQALELAKQHVTLKPKDGETIFDAKKSLLYKEGEPWIKKQSNNFDVTMGSYDGAEVCELIGILMLSLVGSKYNPNNIGLYRDDGLAVFKNTGSPQTEKVKNIF